MERVCCAKGRVDATILLKSILPAIFYENSSALFLNLMDWGKDTCIARRMMILAMASKIAGGF